MTYGEHISFAVRYATLVLTDPEPPAPGELPAVLILRDDFAAAMTGLAAALADRHDRRDIPGSVRQLARDPVGALVAHLAASPVLGAGWEGRPPPSERWSGRPRSPAAVRTLLDGWKGLAVEATLAADTAQRTRPEPSSTNRWTALGDAAILADALAALDPPLIAAAGLPLGQTSHAVDGAAALGVAAREVAALAAGVRADDHAGSRPHPPRPGIVVVTGLPALAAATANLTQLTADTDLHGAAVLHSATLALARTSLAAAAALDAVGRAPDAYNPDLLRAASAALHAHGTRLRHALEAHAPNLATLAPGPLAVRDQAREIVTGTHSRIRDLTPRPAAALAATPALLDYATRVATATDALVAAYQRIDRAGTLLSRDRSEDAPRAGWVPANQLGTVAPLLDGLRQAAQAARAAPGNPRAVVPEPAVTAEVPVRDLRWLLAQRRATVRPDRPALPPRTVPPAAGVPTR